MFFNQYMGGGASPGGPSLFGGSGAPSPAGLTSPGMSPYSLAALMAMSGGGAPPGGASPGGPTLNPMQKPAGGINPAGAAPAMPSVPPQTPPGAPQGGLPPQLMQMIMQNPALLQRLLSAGGGMGMTPQSTAPTFAPNSNAL